jgi:glycosyltransferase involved in cell wall biosynthesis
MRIGLDGSPLREVKTGVGHYTFELARALASIAPNHNFELISPYSYLIVCNEEAEQSPPNLSFVTAKLNPLSRRGWWPIGLPLYLRRASFDLFHGTNYDVPFWSRCLTVVTIHDLSLLLCPETHEKQLVRRARWRLPMMARTATAIITATESVRREICEHLGIHPSKVTTIPDAPRRSFRPAPLDETIFVRQRLQVEDEFILFVGTIEPRKNLLLLARAFDEILRTTSLRPQLVIAGKEGWLSSELFSYLKSAGISERVRFTGYVSDDELRALYSSCRAFVYPSLYEGFGLPPVEAMACGAPVIASRIPSIIETVGNVARLVSPTDYRDLTQGIVCLLEDSGERNHRSSDGLQRAREFSWERTASATLNVYREVLEKGKSRL